MSRRQPQVDSLSWSQIEKQLGPVAAVFRQHAIYECIDSTNEWALQCCSDAKNLPAVCLAEYQEQGRGRRGRKWVSPRSGNIYMSLAWSFSAPISRLAPLSLVVGIAVVRALRAHAVDAALKWPNDVTVAGRKIAGILIESRVRGQQNAEAAIGLGLNFSMGEDKAASISQPWTDFLRESGGEPSADRNRLVAEVLIQLVDTIKCFEYGGFESLRDEWCQYDVCLGKTVDLVSDAGRITGQALGVDEAGAIRVRTETGVEVFHSAEVSLRVEH